MPQLDDILEKRDKRVKKFKKKNYRAWDFSGEIVDSIDSESEKNSIVDIMNDLSTIPGSPITVDSTKISEEDDNLIPQVVSKEDVVEVAILEKGNIALESIAKSDKIKDSQRKRSSKTHRNLAVTQRSEPIALQLSIYQKIMSLKGTQQKIFAHVIALCNQNGGITTGPIYSSMLQYVAECTYEVMKIAIKRLICKNLIQRDSLNGQKGPGSALHFIVNSETQQIAIDCFKNTGLQSGNTETTG